MRVSVRMISCEIFNACVRVLLGCIGVCVHTCACLCVYGVSSFGYGSGCKGCMNFLVVRQNGYYLLFKKYFNVNVHIGVRYLLHFP